MTEGFSMKKVHEQLLENSLGSLTYGG